MLKLKKVSVLILGLFLLSNSEAQDLRSAIQLTENERFESATAKFKTLLQSNPNNGDIYFYFGENYFKLEDFNNALATYTKGTQMEALNPLNFVGLGKVALYKNDTINARIHFNKAISLLPSKANKTCTIARDKQAIVYMEIAEAYIKSENKDLPKALTLLQKAQTLDFSNPELFIIMGDYYLESNDGSNAIVNYKKAQELCPQSSKAKLRIGQLWVRAKNYNDALSYYKEAIQIDSTFAPAYRELGELYAMAGQYENARKNYKKFLAINNNDISAKVRYALFLFMTKYYTESLNLINEIFKTDTTYIILNRIAAYSYYETGDYTKALMKIEKYLNSAVPEKIISSDYAYYGRILSKLSKDSLAIEKFDKAIALDQKNTDLFIDKASSYNKMKKYDMAAKTYEQKIAANPTANDYYLLGKAYYNAQQWNKADTAFAYLTTNKPDFIPGFRWRALTNVNLDPETTTGLAKPFYESFVEKALSDTVKYANELIEAYSYLAYYFLKNKDYCKTIECWEKVQRLDAKNEKAISSLKDLKGKCPK